MRVRVYDRDRGDPFQSELYALVSAGVFERCLVVQDGLLRFFPRVAENEQRGFDTVTSFIDPALPTQWLCLRNDDIRDWPGFPRVHGPYPAFQGYPWVWEDRRTLERLLCGESVPLAETGFPSISSHLPGWTYVDTPADAGHLLEEAHSFHDAVLVSLDYVSGAGRTETGIRVCDTDRRVTMLFHCDWTPPIELVFEGVKGLNLRPGGTNVCSAISSADCRVRDAAVFFCDGDCDREEDYEGTKILAYSLRWRFLPPQRFQSAPAGGCFPLQGAG